MLRGSPVAQLSDDCFAFGGDLLTVDAALRMIATGVTCVDGMEQMDLRAADGRILAEDVIAPVDLPPFDNAAVDGYAVRLADLEGSPELPVDGRLAAGAPVTHALAARHRAAHFHRCRAAARCRHDLHAGGRAARRQRPRAVSSRFAAGREYPAAGRGHRAWAHARCGKASGCGRKISRWRRRWVCDGCRCGDLSVSRLFSTGNELVEPGLPTGPSAALRFQPGSARRVGLPRGSAGSWTSVFCRIGGTRSPSALTEAARDCDLILTSGGVSAGEEDHVKAAVEAGGRLVFWRLAIKPGRPVAMGRVAGVPFIGLPGNPAAAFITFVHVARPLIAALGGAPVEPPVTLRVTRGLSLPEEGRTARICSRAASNRPGW